MKLLKEYVIINKRESHDSGKPLYLWRIAANYGDRGGYLSLSLFTSYIVFKKSSINCNVCKKSWYDILKPSLCKNLEGIFCPPVKEGLASLSVMTFLMQNITYLFIPKMQFYLKIKIRSNHLFNFLLFFLRLIFQHIIHVIKHLQTTNSYSKI